MPPRYSTKPAGVRPDGVRLYSHSVRLTEGLTERLKLYELLSRAKDKNVVFERLLLAGLRAYKADNLAVSNIPEGIDTQGEDEEE